MEGKGQQTPPRLPPFLLTAPGFSCRGGGETLPRGQVPAQTPKALVVRLEAVETAFRYDPEAQRGSSPLKDQPVDESQPHPQDQSQHFTAALTSWLLPLWGCWQCGGQPSRFSRDGSVSGMWTFRCQSQDGPGKTGKAVTLGLGE